MDVAKSSARARAILGKHGPGLVFVMIQKQGSGGAPGSGMAADTSLGEANADDSIVVLVDEAHRSHTASSAPTFRSRCRTRPGSGSPEPRS